MDKINNSKLIKEYRNEAMISQEEFAELIGVSFASVNRWENGHFEPTLKVKRRIKQFFIENGMWNTNNNTKKTGDNK